jgi:hypothetical protein
MMLLPPPPLEKVNVVVATSAAPKNNLNPMPPLRKTIKLQWLLLNRTPAPVVPPASINPETGTA